MRWDSTSSHRGCMGNKPVDPPVHRFLQDLEVYSRHWKKMTGFRAAGEAVVYRVQLSHSMRDHLASGFLIFVEKINPPKPRECGA